MQRISEPQMVEAFTRKSTSPCPGAGTGTVRISTVELPGRNAAVMVSFISSSPYERGRLRVSVSHPEFEALRAGANLPLGFPRSQNRDPEHPASVVRPDWHSAAATAA